MKIYQNLKRIVIFIVVIVSNIESLQFICIKENNINRKENYEERQGLKKREKKKKKKKSTFFLASSNRVIRLSRAVTKGLLAARLRI